MNEAALKALLEPLLDSRGLELDHLQVVPAGRRSVLRITVDGEGPKGRGPLLDDIATATRAISEALDESTATGDAPYTLEVSSRGTSAPLTEPKHYRRNRGRLVKLSLADGGSLTARILSSTDEAVTVEFTPEPTKQVKHPAPETREIALADVRKAVVQVELNRPFDPELDDEVEGDDSTDDSGDDSDDEEN
ncbi:ribosome maturation factor RimP [Propionibacteriaceae bacterium G1746]